MSDKNSAIVYTFALQVNFIIYQTIRIVLNNNKTERENKTGLGNE